MMEWLPMSQYGSTAAELPDAFVMYLARFLLTYDAHSAEWYRSIADALPGAWSDEQLNSHLSDATAGFGASLTYRLAPFATDDASGSTRLWKALQLAYGAQAGVQEQLPLLFAFLPPPQQPVEMMRAALAGPRLAPPAAAASADAALPLTAEWAAASCARPPRSCRPPLPSRRWTRLRPVRAARRWRPRPWRRSGTSASRR